LFSDVKQDHHFSCDGRGTGGSSSPRLSANLHSLERVEPKGLQSRLLREQSLLRDINEKHRADFPATREKCFGIRVERDVRGNSKRYRTGLRFVRSTAFFLAHVTECDRHTATRGSLHVSHLIHGR
jgi:hypothetical protein